MKAANQNDEEHTITFVFKVSLANSERVLKPSLASFLSTSLVPLQITTISFFVRFSVFKFIELVISFMFSLGFVFPKMLYELPSMSDNLPEQPHT